jgi:HlyD family secretion protein
MKFFKWLILIVVVIIAAAVAYYFYQGNRAGNGSDQVTRYKEYEVTRGSFKTMVSASGVIVPIDRVEIKSKASGRIDDFPVEEGDFVKKGDLICRLDQTDIQAEVDQAQADIDIARAELKQAQTILDRSQQLYDKKLISAEEWDKSTLTLAQAKGKLIRARTSLDQANVRLDETIVKAPIDGIILQKYVEAGQIIASGISNVSGGSPIADVADMSFVHVEAGIDEIDVGKVRIAQPANVVAEAYPNMATTGEIIRIAPEAKVEQNVTLFDVVIAVENTRGRLKSGMNATVEISIVDKVDVLLVPSMALNTPGMSGGQGGSGMSGMSGRPGMSGMSGMQGGHGGQGGPPGGQHGGHGGRNIRMALVKEGDEFVPRRIEIGLSNFRQTIVVSGLEEGDIVGVPMVSRLKAENDRLEERIKSTRSFGSSGSSSSRSGGKGK